MAEREHGGMKGWEKEHGGMKGWERGSMEGERVEERGHKLSFKALA